MASRFNFRVWGKNTKNFVVGMNIFMRGGKYALSQIDKFLNPITLASENYIIMQSTGLEDKNGKEIFEGDIVEIKHEIEDKTTKVYNEVYYDEKKCWFILKNKNKQNNAPCSYSESKFCEVVGNIYENKELLEK